MRLKCLLTLPALGDDNSNLDGVGGRGGLSGVSSGPEPPVPATVYVQDGPA